MEMLVQFDLKLELVLALGCICVGVGSVLPPRMPDVIEKPIAFASHMLLDTERRYSQVEKEALANAFGVHLYVYGQRFYLQTDHKALTTLLSKSCPVPCTVSFQEDYEMGLDPFLLRVHFGVQVNYTA